MVDSAHEFDEGSAAAPLEAALRGSLPCINCGYELQGLSIRGACPECGLSVRATILYRVDPESEAFHPLPTPLLTASGVAMFGTFALIAALAAWAPRLSDVIAEISGSTVAHRMDWAAWTSAIALGLSGLGAVGLIRPTRDTKPQWRFIAAGGVLAYIPLIWCWARIHFVVDAASLGAPYFDLGPNPERIALRLGMGASALMILLSLRPNARELVARSLVLRTGRVDRQTIYATAAAVVLGMIGDGFRMGATFLPASDRVFIGEVGTVLVLVSSLLVTLALIGATIDGWRIRRSLLTPTPTLGQLIEFRRPDAA